MKAERERDMQADWFIREVKRCRALGMPLGCCDEWPECRHVSEWVDNHPLSTLDPCVDAGRHVCGPVSSPDEITRLARVVVERYGRVWAKDTDYYAAAEVLGIEEPPEALA